MRKKALQETVGPKYVLAVSEGQISIVVKRIREICEIGKRDNVYRISDCYKLYGPVSWDLGFKKSKSLCLSIYFYLFFVIDEHCGSLLFSAPNLPIDMDNSWAQFPVATEETEDDPAEKKKDEVDGPKGKEEDEDDPWVITKEQRKYYTQQFQNLQQDLALSIKGRDE